MNQLTRRDRWIGLALGLAATVILAAAGNREGFTRDEGYYFDAAELYVGWYGELFEHPSSALTQASVDRWFGYNHEHPALMKTLYGISWRLFHKCKCTHQPGRHSVGYDRPHRTLPILSEAQAMRLPANAFGGWMVALCWLFGVRAWSRRAGAVAAVLSLAATRIFFNAELACFDAPMATTWLATVYFYYAALDGKSRAWPAGVALGLAVATKHNGFFLPFVLGAHWLAAAALAWRRKERLPTLRPFFWMAGRAPLIELAHWPWMWFHTVARFREYFGFHLHHVYYNMEYLGTNYNKPPFPVSFAFVMTLLTAPVTTLALALGGASALGARFARGQRARELPGLLVGLNVFAPIAIIAFTGAPIFGATKHWLPSIPFLALLAGFGLDRLATAAGEALALDSRRKTILGVAAVALACAPACAETFRSHPYALTHYNLLAGGPPGGASLGMNRQFWGYSTRGLLPWIDAHARPGAPIYWHDTNQPILNMNVREGLMRADLGNTGLEEPGVKASDIAMVIHEKHFNKYEYWIWDFYGTTRPSVVLDDEGVPIVTLYERPRAP